MNHKLHFLSQTHNIKLLPRGAAQGGGRAAGEVLLYALVVADLRGDRDRGGLSSRGHHGGLSWRGLRLSGGKKRGNEGGYQVCSRRLLLFPNMQDFLRSINTHNSEFKLKVAFLIN